MHFGQIWANRSSCTTVWWTVGQAEAGCWILENWTNFPFYFQFTLSHKQSSSSVSSVFHPKMFSQPKSGSPTSRAKPFNEIYSQLMVTQWPLFLWITIGTVIKRKFEVWNLNFLNVSDLSKLPLLPLSSFPHSWTHSSHSIVGKLIRLWHLSAPQVLYIVVIRGIHPTPLHSIHTLNQTFCSNLHQPIPMAS